MAKSLEEVLDKSADAGEYIKDFEKSKSPQFKGKSKKKRREMAIAAFMSQKKMKKEELAEIVKELLGEAKAYKITSATGQTTTQSFSNDAEANDFKTKNSNIRNVQALEEDDLQDPNDESDMAKSQLHKTAKYSIELLQMIKDGQQLDAWVQAKLTKVADYMDAVKHYLEGEEYLNSPEAPSEEEPMDEKMDPVGKEDSDINNDGKVDKTDKYLKKRRVSISKAMSQHKK